MNTRRKIVVGFIIYKPESSFLGRLKDVILNGYQIYIFDNSPEESGVRDFCLARNEVRYLTIGKNAGLGLGMASICAQAYYENNSALIFFDQDTVFGIETLAFIEGYYIKHKILDSTHSAIVFAARDTHGIDNSDCFQNVLVAINSGSLFFLKNLKYIGWHNEEYFVDGVDYEFCLNSKRHGLRIGKFMCTPGFDHSIEQADKKYKILNKSFVFRAYPLFRILDTIKSSCKLLLLALIYFEFAFAALILKFFSVYVLVQVASRFLKPIK
ncbi:hypothetical protein BH10PSE16_BH10PSE16_23400 [soil metagenome]